MREDCRLGYLTCALFCCYEQKRRKKNKIYHVVGTVAKSNLKIVSTEVKLDTPNTHIHHHLVQALQQKVAGLS